MHKEMKSYQPFTIFAQYFLEYRHLPRMNAGVTVNHIPQEIASPPDEISPSLGDRIPMMRYPRLSHEL